MEGVSALPPCLNPHAYATTPAGGASNLSIVEIDGHVFLLGVLLLLAGSGIAFARLVLSFSAPRELDPGPGGPRAPVHRLAARRQTFLLFMPVRLLTNSSLPG